MENAKPKALKLIAAFVLLLLLLNLAALVVLMSVALSKTSPKIEKADSSALFNVAAKFQNLPARIKKSVPGDVDTIAITEADFNCLMAAALGQDGLAELSQEPLPVNGLSLKLKEGVLYADFSKDIGFWTPFGSKLNAQSKLRVEFLEDGSLKTKLLSLKLGKLNVAPWLAQWWLDWKTDELEDAKEAEDFKRIVVSIKTPPGRLLIRYHPYELKKEIDLKLKSPMMKSFWDML